MSEGAKPPKLPPRPKIIAALTELAERPELADLAGVPELAEQAGNRSVEADAVSDEALADRVLALVLAGLDAGQEQLPRAAVGLAVRVVLIQLAVKAPGRSVEVRVPPFLAIQAVAGPRHTRGTPPNLVEAEPITFLRVATGRADWASAVADGRISHSGSRSDISELFPL